ncbi:hypothetical protein [Microvirga sp. 2TAF3]|uniref:hypothetical protein n=1 Tax=Microvirga sp. 2TAF3 TaxID=3233014 RepID=UPI003F967A54
MNDTEVDIVAAELAKIGGTSWYPGRENGPILRVVTERYRDRARAAIAALDRYRATQENSPGSDSPGEDKSNRDATSAALVGQFKPGMTVVYRPPGDRRAYSCTIEKVTNDFVYLVPKAKNRVGWVPASEMRANPSFVKDLQSEEEIRNRTKSDH